MTAFSWLRVVWKQEDKKNRIVIYDPNSLEEGFEAPELFVIRLKRLP